MSKELKKSSLLNTSMGPVSKSSTSQQSHNSCRFHKTFFGSSPHKTSSPSTSLSQLTQQQKLKQLNKKIHNMTKESFITRKKMLLLNKKFFYDRKKLNEKGKPTDQSEEYSMDKLREQNKCSVYEELINVKPIEQDDIFNVSQQLMKQPFKFHRNMLIKIKDDNQTKSILKKWYHQNVAHKIEKLRQIQTYEKQRSMEHKRRQSYFNLTEKLKTENKRKNSILSKGRCKSSNNQIIKEKGNIEEMQVKHININEWKNKYNGQQRTDTKKDTENLAKLMLRVQPFWYKVRLKI